MFTQPLKYLQRIFLPTDYDASTLTNDIALLELETKIIFDRKMCKNVKPAELWEHDLSAKEGDRLILIGLARTGTKGSMKTWK